MICCAAATFFGVTLYHKLREALPRLHVANTETVLTHLYAATPLPYSTKIFYTMTPFANHHTLNDS